jgi:hypothetical protein
MGIMFGGDPESFMEAPRMENKSLSESLGISPIAAFLDMIGVHRQVAKGPKTPKDSKAKEEKTFQPEISPTTIPAVLTDLESMLSPATASAPVMAPITRDSPMTEWGRKWLDANRAITKIDPDSYLP